MSPVLPRSAIMSAPDSSNSPVPSASGTPTPAVGAGPDDGCGSPVNAGTPARFHGGIGLHEELTRLQGAPRRGVSGTSGTDDVEAGGGRERDREVSGHGDGAEDGEDAKGKCHTRSFFLGACIGGLQVLAAGLPLQYYYFGLRYGPVEPAGESDMKTPEDSVGAGGQLGAVGGAGPGAGARACTPFRRADGQSIRVTLRQFRRALRGSTNPEDTAFLGALETAAAARHWVAQSRASAVEWEEAMADALGYFVLVVGCFAAWKVYGAGWFDVRFDTCGAGAISDWRVTLKRLIRKVSSSEISIWNQDRLDDEVWSGLEASA